MDNNKIINNLVSIVMPAYNCEKYIKKSIISVLQQTYKEWELIVIDDGSTDNTISIIEELVNKDNRIRFYKNKINMGVSSTRNIGIELAKGEWIAFLDSDDIWIKTKLEKQMKLYIETGAEFIFTGSAYINENGEPYEGIFEVPKLVNYKKLKIQNVISCSSVLVKKKFFNNIKMMNDDMHEDYAVWLRILEIGIDAYGINEPLIIYRISKNSKSGNKIKTLKMTYRVFRFIGDDVVSSIYFTFNHVVRSVINKYSKVKSKPKPKHKERYI